MRGGLNLKSCCFTGHRPKFFPWGNDTDDIRAKRLMSAMEEEIKIAIDDRYDRFLWGGALGVDTWAAKYVSKLKTQHTHITLAAVLPYKEYNKFVTDYDYLEALENSDETIIVGDFKNMHMLAARDRYMIDNSDRIIAVYDERSNIKSGTYRALMYAKEKAVEVRQINWMDFCK